MPFWGFYPPKRPNLAPGPSPACSPCFLAPGDFRRVRETPVRPRSPMSALDTFRTPLTSYRIFPDYSQRSHDVPGASLCRDGAPGSSPGPPRTFSAGVPLSPARPESAENVNHFSVPGPAGKWTGKMFPGLSARVRPQKNVRKKRVPSPGPDSLILDVAGPKNYFTSSNPHPQNNVFPWF